MKQSAELPKYMFRRGINHNTVGTLKNFLNNRSGISISDLKNNSFDEQTSTALATFQQSKNLLPTGAMDLKTWLAIGKEMDPITISLVSMSDPILRDLLSMGYRSRFPFKKFSSNNSFKKPIKVTSAQMFAAGAGAEYSFTFRLFVSVFAPFEWFGPLNWAKGDGVNRKFSINPKDTYRLRSFSTIVARSGTYKTYDLETTYSKTEVSPAAKSFQWTLWNQDPDPIESEASLKREELSTDIYTPRSPSIENSRDKAKYHMFGNDDAWAWWGGDSWLTSDIDVHPDISFHHERDKENPKRINMRASGIVTGDQFPAVEVYVLDAAGNGVMLGVWQVRLGAVR